MLAAAPSPEQGRWLTTARVAAMLRRAGRQRNHQAAAERIVAALHTEQLTARPGVVSAYAASTSALVAVLAELSRQVELLAEQVGEGFGRHPEVEIYLSQPGLGQILVPGCLPSSETTPTVTPIQEPGRTTPEWRRSPRHLE